MNEHPENPGPCFELKSKSMSLVFVELYYYDEQDFEELLRQKIGQAPGFFRDAPIVIDLEKYRGLPDELNFFNIIGLCRRHNMHIVSVQVTNERLVNAAKSAGLAITKPGGKKTTPVCPEKEEKPEPPAKVTSDSGNELTAIPPKVITQPVRSGQQIHAPHGDLIVLAPVQPGSELLAAGNIHVYGPLRGRALAGINGDEQARIFTLSLEAELVSIAGQYKISEDLQGGDWKKPVQLHLADGQLFVNPLDNH